MGGTHPDVKLMLHTTYTFVTFDFLVFQFWVSVNAKKKKRAPWALPVYVTVSCKKKHTEKAIEIVNNWLLSKFQNPDTEDIFSFFILDKDTRSPMHVFFGDRKIVLDP